MKNSYEEQQRKLEEKVYEPTNVCHLRMHELNLAETRISLYPLIKQPNTVMSALVLVPYGSFFS